MRCEDLIHLSALLELFDDRVYCTLHLVIALLKRNCIGILKDRIAIHDRKLAIGRLDQLLSRNLVHHDAVNLGISKIRCRLRKLCVALHTLRRSVIRVGNPQICDVALLDTHCHILQCIRGRFLHCRTCCIHDNHVAGINIFIGEVHNLLTIRRNGNASRHNVNLPLLDCCQCTVKIHILNDEFDTQLVCNRLADVDIDSLNLIAYQILIRSKTCLRTDGQLTVNHRLDS